MTPGWQRLSWILFGLSAAVGARAATFTVTVAPSGMLTFSPSALTISVGDTVHWVWGSSFHSTTSGSSCTPDGRWDSSVQAMPFAFDVTFTTPGTFPYFCSPHCGLGMTGTIIVNAPERFFTVTPCRVVDTRGSIGPYGGPPLQARADRTFVFGGRCAIPSTAAAVVLNVVVVNPTDGPGFLTLFPGGTTRPLASTINYNVGGIRANNAIIPLGALKDITVHCGQGTGTTDMVIDVSGYFQ